MENTTKEKIKDILKKLCKHEISLDQAVELITHAKHGGEASTQDSGPPAGGGGGGNPGGGNP